jgi:HK97 family phage portal protein
VILATPKGNRAAFQAAFDSSLPIPRASQGSSGSYSFSRRRVEMSDAIGVPAFSRGVRLICDTAAGFPISVYRGSGVDRQPMPDSPQAALMRSPGGREFTAQQVWSYAFASMLRGGAYLVKVKNSDGSVAQLLPIDPRLVSPKYKDGTLLFDLKDKPNGRVKRRVGRETILYAAGVLVDHPAIGVSIVEAFRNEIGTQLSRQEFEGRYLANDGFPGVVLRHESNVTKEQRDELRDSFEARHVGASNAGRPAVLWGGWELERLSMTMTDAQFIESQRFGVQEVGRMLGIPPGLLNDPDDRGSLSIEQENMRFLQYGLEPWMTRLEQSLSTDSDLFPDPEWTVEFDPARLLRADIKNRFDAYRLARQGGWITANEIRTVEGYAPVDGGDEIQQTPVGGAPNDAPSVTTSNQARRPIG